MRVFALSDIHVDYDVNARWVSSLSSSEYRDDVLILAGDVTDTLSLLGSTLRAFVGRFRKVLFVPGNHELWVIRDEKHKGSLQKFAEVRAVVSDCGASLEPYRTGTLSVVPLLSWYDYSFGKPSAELRSIWMDFVACRWPNDYDAPHVAAYFMALNDGLGCEAGRTLITFSHFLPRIDLMPNSIPLHRRELYPVLGSASLDRRLRELGSSMHVYGHSHVNRNVEIDGVRYVNNAFGYPQETHIAAKQLLCIYDTG